MTLRAKKSITCLYHTEITVSLVCRLTLVCRGKELTFTACQRHCAEFTSIAALSRFRRLSIHHTLLLRAVSLQIADGGVICPARRESVS